MMRDEKDEGEEDLSARPSRRANGASSEAARLQSTASSQVNGAREHVLRLG